VLASVLGLTAVALLRAVGATAAHRNRFRLAPQPRPATDAEPLLQSLVLLPILQRCPDEQATDKNGGQEDEEDKNDRSGTIHTGKSFPPKRISSPTNVPPQVHSPGSVRIAIEGALQTGTARQFRQSAV
jgi:hypothetical protein